MIKFEELVVQAQALGVKVDGRWKKKRLLYEIEKASNDASRLYEIECAIGETIPFCKVEINHAYSPDNFSDNEIITNVNDEIFSVKNLSANKFVCGTFVCEAKEIVIIDGFKQDDLKLMKVLNRQVEIGKFEIMD